MIPMDLQVCSELVQSSPLFIFMILSGRWKPGGHHAFGRACVCVSADNLTHYRAHQPDVYEHMNGCTDLSWSQ